MAAEVKRKLKCKKEHLPKVGDTFYWESNGGELKESVCQRITNEDEPNVETCYFTYWDGNFGSFISAGDILDPCSTRVHELKCEKEKKAWREFFTEERLKEIASASMILNNYDDWKDFVESKF